MNTEADLAALCHEFTNALTEDSRREHSWPDAFYFNWLCAELAERVSAKYWI